MFIAPNEIYFLGIFHNNKIQVYNRKSGLVIREVACPKFGDFNTLAPLLGFDDKIFPYCVINDSRCLIILNTKAMEIIKIMDLRNAGYCDNK